MLTQCPHCSTVFRLRPAQLSAAGGKVRCGRCHSVFNANQHLVEEQSPQPDAPTPSSTPNRLEDWAPNPQHSATTTRAPSQSPPVEPASPRSEAVKPAVVEPAVVEPAVVEPAVVEPAVAEPAVAEPNTDHGAPSADVDDLSIQLDQLFSDIDQSTERSTAAPAPAQPPAAASHESFGEVQIETLLTSEAGPEALELPWHQEEPAAVAADIAADLNPPPGNVDDDVAEFDLPDPQLTTAQTIHDAPSPPPPAFSEITSPQRRSGWAAFGWAMAILLALTALVGQYAYINSFALVRYSQLRPALEQLCRYTGCALPARRDVKDITLLERDVHSSNKYQGVLVISATLVNRAPFAQPYPDVEVAMHDVDGNVVASRLFKPHEYLAPDEHHASFAPGATAHLELRVADPGPAAVGFEFTFY